MQQLSYIMVASAFERIQLAASRTNPARADELLAFLRAELVEIESAVALVPRIIAKDPEAETSFRGLLEYAVGTNLKPEVEPLVRKRRTKPRPPQGGASFASADMFVELSVAAALIARDEADWKILRNQIIALSEYSEWFEELAAVATDPELAEFQALATLFLRDRPASGALSETMAALRQKQPTR